MTEVDDVGAIKGITFCHLNVRSIMSKIDQFRMHFAKSAIDIITVSESWLTPDIDSSIVGMEGYQLLRADRMYRHDAGARLKKGGGLLIYIKNYLNFVLEYNDDLNIGN